MLRTDCFTHLDYETRNLGRASFAITDEFLNAPDNFDLNTAIHTLPGENGELFIQARLLPGQMAAQLVIAKHGFHYIETALTPTCRLSKNLLLENFRSNRAELLPRKFLTAALQVCTLQPGDSECHEQIKRIAAESFVSDRFHIDPHCLNHLADRRYVLWVTDLLQSDACFHLLYNHDQLIGFLVRAGSRLLLAGFARTYAMSGLGEYFWLSVLNSMAAEGIELVTTQISTNNLPVLNMYARLGFKFRDAVSLFHYWSPTSK